MQDNILLSILPILGREYSNPQEQKYNPTSN